MTQRDLSGYSIDDMRAQRALEAVQEFVAEFKRRQEPGQLRQLTEGESLNGGILGQAPEDFTEHELIEPCLRALGYSDTKQSGGPPSGAIFRRQPSKFPKVERKRPDYELLNVHDRLTCIIEVKAINRDSGEAPEMAIDDIRSYLEEDTFCNHKSMNSADVLVGIGTDGFHWEFCVKDIESGKIHKSDSSVSILSAVRSIMSNDIQEVKPEDEVHETRIRVRNELKSGLVATFSVENLVPEIVDTADEITV